MALLNDIRGGNVQNSEVRARQAWVATFWCASWLVVGRSAGAPLRPPRSPGTCLSSVFLPPPERTV